MEANLIRFIYKTKLLYLTDIHTLRPLLSFLLLTIPISTAVNTDIFKRLINKTTNIIIEKVYTVPFCLQYMYFIINCFSSFIAFIFG